MTRVAPAKRKDKAEKLEARKAESIALLDNADEPPPLLHPNMARMYQDRIAKLCENLQSKEDRGAAARVLWSLVDEIALVPENGELSIILRGEHGAIKRLAVHPQNPGFVSMAEVLGKLATQVSLTAGAGSEPAACGLSDLAPRPRYAPRSAVPGKSSDASP